MADTEVVRTIERLNRKIEALQDLRRKLAEEFGISLDAVVIKATPTPGSKKSRKEVLADFLRANGAMTRADIVSKAGMPEGTVSYCLNDKEYFLRLEDNRWDITDRPQPELMKEAV